jgi:hypothetical protein
MLPFGTDLVEPLRDVPRHPSCTILGGTLDDVNLDLKPEIWARITADGLPMRKEFQAPPNAFKVRIALCDVSTGRLGSVSIPLTHVPQGR